MQFCYGNKNILRVLDEAEFWKKQEQEHTIVIEQIAKGLEVEYLDKLSDFRHEFRKDEANVLRSIETLIRIEGCISYDFLFHLMEFIRRLIRQSGRFIYFLNDILKNSQIVKTDMVAQTVINHIIRESQYFIGVAQTILPCNYDR